MEIKTRSDEIMVYLISLVINDKKIRDKNSSKKFILLLARKVPKAINKTIINTAFFLYFFRLKKIINQKLIVKKIFVYNLPQ